MIIRPRSDSALPHRTLEAGTLIKTRLDLIIANIYFRKIERQHATKTYFIEGAFILHLIMIVIERMFRDGILRFEGMPKHSEYLHAMMLIRSIKKRVEQELHGGHISHRDLPHMIELILFRFMCKQHLVVLERSSSRWHTTASTVIVFPQTSLQ